MEGAYRLRKEEFFILFCILVVLFFSSTDALTLGSSISGSYAEIKPGGTAKFTIFLWNSKNSSFPVKLRAEHLPEDMTVFIRPKELILNFSGARPGEKGKYYIMTRSGMMKMTPVEVFIKTKPSAEPGEYRVRITAIAGGLANSGVSTLVEKSFEFTLNVSKPGFLESMRNVLIQIPRKVTGEVVKEPVKLSLLLVFLIAVGIFVLSWIIYKHA